ncbi:hypothetical protein PGT21_034851 [Puccinia graminis f. sp. tritici]|uniref:Uncharacterized protein n=2 Tax=Puccinia graminis f. sp. tritici TaxID=56615 RepID=E3KYS9_PUCGT|nr:uncharacterized protein PGTG_15317 [Puccinia graminis f. sp. tritici CRL 75-36-700-3]EFP89475.1 hypothetical protein PGTG_15317 [Puccinia graminis f. sp. tritici CRL 75-36-700-3]KAA1078415.1 hypothetical protein PGT21_034851 [Puccinia graminis f. sp. tritici]
MGKLSSSFHLPSTLTLGPEPTGAVRTLKRRILSVLVVLSISASLFFLTPKALRKPSFSSTKFFRLSHSLGPVVIKPVEIQYDPRLFGLDAPVEWYKASLASAIAWTNPLRWPILLTSSRLLRATKPLSLRVFPRVIQLESHAPSSSDLIFGMATTAQRASVLSELWPVWLGAKDDEGEAPLAVVVLPQEDHDGGAQSAANVLSEKLKTERGLDNVLLTTSWLGQSARYELRYFGMLRDMNEAARQADREPLWYIVGDDDTLWTDERMLRRELSKYDPSQSWFLGASSEGVSQIQQFGNMAFGGAGIIISRGLCKEMLKIHADCVEQTKDVFGGDEMYSLCAARAAGHGKTKETVVTQISSLHQLDLPGDGTGFFQSGFPFLSLHHLWHGWTDAFAREHQTSFDRPDNALNHLLLLQQAARILGGDNFMRRAIYDDGRELVTLGYTVTRFDVPLRREDMQTIEKTWSGDSDFPLRFPTRPRIIETDQSGTAGKRTFYLCEIRFNKASPNVFSFIHRDRWGEYAVITWRED